MKKNILLFVILCLALSVFGGYYYGQNVLPSLNSPYYSLPAYSGYSYPSYNYQTPYYGYGYGYLNYPTAYRTITPTVRYSTYYVPTYVPVTTVNYGARINYHYSYAIPGYPYYPTYNPYSYGAYSNYYPYSYGW